jgi:hypothetical protein
MLFRLASLGVLLSTAIPVARAADTEVRVFTVIVDGKKAGDFSLTIRTSDDGAESATASASVVVKQFIGSYRYNLRCTEVWSAGRLKGLDSYSNDDGERHYVRVTGSEKGCLVSVDGQRDVDAPARAWPNTYWRQPDVARADGPIIILNVDNGEVITASLERRGSAKVQSAGQSTDSIHYRIRGAVEAELWFDGRGRLVREETIDDGHRMVLELREIRH